MQQVLEKTAVKFSFENRPETKPALAEIVAELAKDGTDDEVCYSYYYFSLLTL
jgi:hypothetical protein